MRSWPNKGGSMAMELLRNRFKGCLMGVLAGDALGQPVEMMTAIEILEATGGRGVAAFMDPLQTRIVSTRLLKKGDYTDDWQLTRAIARSIVYMQDIERHDIALKHLEEMKDPRGWGRATKQALEEIDLYFRTGGQQGRSPNKASSAAGKADQGGCGNGVAMKISPVALFHSLDTDWPLADERALAETAAIGLMTHHDIRASICAYAICDLVMGIVRLAAEAPLNAEKMEAFAKQYMFQGLCYAENVYANLNTRQPFVSEIFGQMLASGSWRSIDQSVASIGTNCFALESVPFAVAAFMRHPQDFKAAVLEAVNAGGDTDSTASMAGALVGANVGIEGIPGEFKDFRPEC